MERCYEAVIELVEEEGSVTLPDLPADIDAYAKDTWTGKRIPLKLEGKTKLPEGQVQWSTRANLLSWSDVDESRFTVFVTRAASEQTTEAASEEAQQ